MKNYSDIWRGKNNVKGNKSEIQIHILDENHAG